MSSFAVSVDVPVQADAVYAFVAQDYATNHPRWDAGIVAVDLPGPVRAGARGREVRRFSGRTSTTHFEVLAAERPSRLVLRDEPAVWALTRTYEITSLGAIGTRLTLVFDMTPRAAGFRLVHPILRPLLRRQVRATVVHLGRLLGGDTGLEQIQIMRKTARRGQPARARAAVGRPARHSTASGRAPGSAGQPACRHRCGDPTRAR